MTRSARWNPRWRTSAGRSAAAVYCARESYWDNDAEKARRVEMKMRLDLYRDRGRLHFEAMVDDVFKNSQVREWRKLFVKYAGVKNVTKRIVREISTVYSATATRTTPGD